MARAASVGYASAADLLARKPPMLQSSPRGASASSSLREAVREHPPPQHQQDWLLRECGSIRSLDDITEAFLQRIAREEPSFMGPARMESEARSRQPSATDVPASSLSGAPPGAPPSSQDDALLRKRLDFRSVADIVEALVAEATPVELRAPAAPWGEKSGFSVFDEEHILGGYAAGDFERYDYEDEDFHDDYDDSDFDSVYDSEEGWDLPEGAGIVQRFEPPPPFGGGLLGVSFWEDGAVDMEAYYDAVLFPPRRPDVYAASADVPRTARLVRPLCRVHTIERELPEGCSICLEGLACGQEAWRLPCTHVFHEACMLRCFRVRRARAICPLCRSDIKRAGAAGLAEVCGRAAPTDMQEHP